jgi:hypothetical protein
MARISLNIQGLTHRPPMSNSGVLGYPRTTTASGYLPLYPGDIYLKISLGGGHGCPLDARGGILRRSL